MDICFICTRRVRFSCSLASTHTHTLNGNPKLYVRYPNISRMANVLFIALRKNPIQLYRYFLCSPVMLSEEPSGLPSGNPFMDTERVHQLPPNVYASSNRDDSNRQNTEATQPQTTHTIRIIYKQSNPNTTIKPTDVMFKRICIYIGRASV